MLKKCFIDHERERGAKNERKIFHGVMNYAYAALDTQPIKNSWFVYLII